MLKVIHVVWSSGIGGIESLVLNLCMEQKNNSQLQVALFTAKSGGLLTEKAKNNHILLHEGGFQKGSINLNAYKKCIHIFKNFDIIHIHSFNPTIALAAINSKKKIIYTEHGNFGFLRKINWIEKINRHLLSFFINNKIDFISFNSEFSKSVALKRYDLSKMNKKVIYNGVPNIESNSRLINQSNKIEIGTVGRLAEVKRIDRLINAFSKIAKKENYKLEIIGDGPSREKLEALSNQNNLSSHITFEGFKSNLNDYYNKWDIAVIPSSGEAFGLVVVEAYRCGLPVAIFSDGGGMVEIVKLCDPELIITSIAELTSLFNNLPHLKYELSSAEKQEKRKIIAKQFSIEKMETAFYSTYISL